jgi:hypothetical protein
MQQGMTDYLIQNMWGQHIRELMRGLPLIVSF